MKTFFIILSFLFASAIADARIAFPCHTGDMYIETAEQLDELAASYCVTGSVWVFGIDAQSIDLPRLRSVSGLLVISSNPNLESIAAPRLVNAGGVIITNNRNLPTCNALQIKNQCSVDNWYMVGGNAVDSCI